MTLKSIYKNTPYSVNWVHDIIESYLISSESIADILDIVVDDFELRCEDLQVFMDSNDEKDIIHYTNSSLEIIENFKIDITKYIKNYIDELTATI